MFDICSIQNRYVFESFILKMVTNRSKLAHFHLIFDRKWRNCKCGYYDKKVDIFKEHISANIHSNGLEVI